MIAGLNTGAFVGLVVLKIKVRNLGRLADDLSWLKR